MKYEPIYDRLLVKLIDQSRMHGDLVIPDVAAASRPYQYGEVVAAGGGRVNLEGKVAPLAVKAGDVVMFPRKSGVRIPMLDSEGQVQRDDDGGEVELLLMREPDVLAIVHDMPRATRIAGLDGRLLKMVPTSKGLPDSVYKNRDDLTQAEKMGFVDKDEFPDDEFEPGDAPDEVSS